VAAFPAPIPRPRAGAADALFVKARDAYLARDWPAAEAHLDELLGIAPTDGEAQLLRATILRRLGRLADARAALAALTASDAGGPWRAEIARELSLAGPARRSPAGSDAAEEATIIPLRPAAADDGPREVAA
jgi:thioredoxin-like negative regulator of GroEL